MQTLNTYFYGSVFRSLLLASTQNDRYFCVTQRDLDENMARKQGRITIVHRASEANGAPSPVADIKVKVCFYCASSSAFQKRRRFAAIVIIIVELLAEICHVERVRSKLLVQ